MLMAAAQVIKLDPSSPCGYERKCAALHGMEDYGHATSAFETMLSKMSESSDPDIRGEGNCFILIFSHLISRCRAISPLCSAGTDEESDSNIYPECHSRFAIGAHQHIIWSSVQQIRAGCRIRIDTTLYDAHHVHDHAH